MATQVVTELGPDDVLFGRGAPIVQTTGNVKFRDLVNANKAAYASTRCRQTKDSIARDIINLIDERGGRFLKEIKSSDDIRKYRVPAGVKAWIVAEYDEIVEKVKQTLRETEKSAAEREADTKSNDRLSTLNEKNSIPDHRIALPVDGNDRNLSVNDHHFLQQVPVHSVSSSLLPPVQQQLLALQNSIRRNQMQQELALSLQRYQNQALLAQASLGTAATRGNGVTPNMLSQQLGPSIGSSLPGQRSIEDYYFAMQGGPTDNPGAMNHRNYLSSMLSNNNYLSTVPSNLLSSLNTSQSAIDEILQRDAMLAALRRHRLQMEDSLQGQSLIRTNAMTVQNDAPPSSDVSLLHLSAMISSDQLRETPTISNVRQLEEMTLSLQPQHNRNDTDANRWLAQTTASRPDAPFQPPAESTDGILKPESLSDSIVGTGDERGGKRSMEENEDELSALSKTSKKRRKNK